VLLFSAAAVSDVVRELAVSAAGARLSPLHAGLTFLPMRSTIMFVARGAGKLVSRFGVRAVLGSGC